MSGGCTIGAKRLPSRFYMFKNRDLQPDAFEEHLVFDDRVFAVTGFDSSENVEVGFSFGVNSSGLAACSSTVLINDCASYDLLLEDILRESSSVKTAIQVVADSIQAGEEYQWCNLILSTLNEVAAIEVTSDEFAVERDEHLVVRTNHHLLMGTDEFVQKASPEQREVCGPLIASQARRQTAFKLLQSANTLQDIIALTNTHSETRAFDSICRHANAVATSELPLGETVHSYILEVLDLGKGNPEMTLHHAKGNPCSRTFQQISIRFDAPSSEKDALVRHF